LAGLYANRGELDRSITLAERWLAMSDETRDQFPVLAAHSGAAVATYYQGRFPVSLAHCERVIALYDPARDRGGAFHHCFPTDPRVTGLGIAAWNLWYLGHIDRSLGRARESVTLARTLGEPFDLALALFMETLVHELRRDWRGGGGGGAGRGAPGRRPSVPRPRRGGRLLHRP